MGIETFLLSVLPKITERAGTKLLDEWKPRRKIRLMTEGAERSLTHHLRMVEKWASEISFRDLPGPKSLTSTFVDLDLHLRRVEMDGAPKSKEKEKFKVSELVYAPSAVILGDPGSGKTTSLKKIAFSILHGTGSSSVPLLVQLRDFATGDSLRKNLFQVLGIAIDGGDTLEEAERANVENLLLDYYLDELPVTLLVDGFDEINPVTRDRVLHEIRRMVRHSGKSRMFLSCRTSEFVYNLDGARVFVLEPLTEPQIREFTDKWLGTSRAEEFRVKVRNNPYSGSEVRPLTLSHLCAIYERLGTVPEKPRTIYRKIVRLLLEEWDEQRSVKRESRYADFTVDRKEEFLEALAYQVTIQLDAVRFTHERLEFVYRLIRAAFRLPESEAAKVVREIESHTGLVIEVAFETYEFTHKSLQEYLTAAYIVRLPKLPSMILHQIPNEAAIAVALSSSASEYFVLMVGIVLSSARGSLSRFSETFVSRLYIERVDFARSVGIGFSVLGLYSATYFPGTAKGEADAPLIDDVRLHHHEPGEGSWATFLSIVAVADSVAAALRRCGAVSTTNGDIRLYPDRNFLPESLRNIRDWTIDETFLSQLTRFYTIHLAENRKLIVRHATR